MADRAGKMSAAGMLNFVAAFLLMLACLQRDQCPRILEMKFFGWNVTVAPVTGPEKRPSTNHKSVMEINEAARRLRNGAQNDLLSAGHADAGANECSQQDRQMIVMMCVMVLRQGLER